MTKIYNIKNLCQFLKISTRSISLPSFIVISLEITKLGGGGGGGGEAKSQVQVGLTVDNLARNIVYTISHYEE